ncbi:DUF420 domain-containing protein, partial [candidate division KSB1 bacterium]|nr:DUF420 domain-containing protein [candidate division KSB1 bacterium]
MNVSMLPTVNAILNGTAGILLLLEYIQIRKGNRDTHKKF